MVAISIWPHITYPRKFRLYKFFFCGKVVVKFFDLQLRSNRIFSGNGLRPFFSRTKIFFRDKVRSSSSLFSNFNPNLRPSVDRDRDFGFRLETISGSNRSRARMRSLCTTSHLLFPIFDLLTILKENLVHSNFWCTTATFIHSNISI